MKGAAELKPFKVLVIKEQKTQIKSILSKLLQFNGLLDFILQ